jgi:DNA-3-methyladenine glycosylase I
MKNNHSVKRCFWAQNNSLNASYHDQEWGVPVYDDIVFFEFIVLESAQAGLSWLTILKRRKNYQRAFAHFDPIKISKFNEKKIKTLLKDEGIIRHRLKIEATITNAKAFIEIQNEFGSFSNYVWTFVNGSPIKRKSKKMPTESVESQFLAKDLKRRGFRFMGATICYAFMQACGLINDHDESCYKSCTGPSTEAK